MSDKEKQAEETKPETAETEEKKEEIMSKTLYPPVNVDELILHDFELENCRKLDKPMRKFIKRHREELEREKEVWGFPKIKLI